MKLTAEHITDNDIFKRKINKFGKNARHNRNRLDRRNEKGT